MTNGTRKVSGCQLVARQGKEDCVNIIIAQYWIVQYKFCTLDFDETTRFNYFYFFNLVNNNIAGKHVYLLLETAFGSDLLYM